MMRWVYRSNRTRLSIEKAKKMVFVAAQQGLKRKFPDDFDDTDGFDVMIQCIIESNAAENGAQLP